MPIFVHLASHRDIASIRRGGIRAVRPSGKVHAMPVTRNFSISHQWVRELRRGGGGTIVGIYFRIPDDERVEVGHFDSSHVSMSAAEGVARMLSAETNDPVAARALDAKSKAVKAGRALPPSPEGFEVVIGRSIRPSEIVRIKAVPQVVGWRYRPGANGTAPCVCICCERGAYGVGKLLRTADEREAAGLKPKATIFGRPERSFRRITRLTAERKS
jgi:hypothetical protein